MISPVRQLYAALVQLESADDLHMNLCDHEDYSALTGSGTARFCEWAHSRIEQRKLIDGLLHSVLRACDISKLAKHLRVSEGKLKGASPQARLEDVLVRLGIRQPMYAPILNDGLKELEAFRTAAETELSGNRVQSLTPGTSAEGLAPACRRGLERMLKLVALFFWDGGLEDTIRTVALEGKHEFRALKEAPSDWSQWFGGADVGTINRVLLATSEEARQRGMRPLFLRQDEELWTKPVFHKVDALGNALNATVHDKIGVGKRLGPACGAAAQLLEIINQQSGLRVPRSIVFFRRSQDAHGTHYDGYDSQGNLVRFFEVEQEYELNTPYVFLAATNPSAVDALCTPMRTFFLQGV